jgi:hypothetical protein
MPTKDFDLSRRFYEELGFEKVLDGEVAIFNRGLRRLHSAKVFPERVGCQFHDATHGG